MCDNGAIKPKYIQELEAHNIPYLEQVTTIAPMLPTQLVIKSPGIPHTNTLIQQLKNEHIPIISEIEFAYQHVGNSTVVAITGSNGKTTTTSITYHIAQHAGLNCVACGNIGNSFARQIVQDPKEVYIVEVSSFQLDDVTTFKPNIAILTNITPDHLDRYNYDFNLYIQAKFKLVQNLTPQDAFIYNADDAVTIQHITQHQPNATNYPVSMKKEFKEGAFIQNNTMVLRHRSEVMEMNVNDLTIKGKHNQYNTMMAAYAVTLLGIKKEPIRQAMTTIENFEHRLEHVATIRGVEYINDSKATNVNSTWYALECMHKPTILILGGVDKGNDYSILEEMVQKKVKMIICLGIDNTKIHQAFGNTTITIVNTLSAAEAVQAAYHFASVGDAVLLSPACASFDLFTNYEDRGQQFKQAVKNL